jgi:hypothetical protein
MKTGSNQHPPRGNRDVISSPSPIPVPWSPAQIRANSCHSRKRPSFPSVSKPGFNRTPDAANVISFGQIRISPTKSDPQKNDFFNPAGSPTAPSRPRSRPSSPATGPSPSRNPFSFNRSRARSCQIVEGATGAPSTCSASSRGRCPSPASARRCNRICRAARTLRGTNRSATVSG